MTETEQLWTAADVAAFLAERTPGARWPRHRVHRLARAAAYAHQVRSGEIDESAVPDLYASLVRTITFPRPTYLEGSRAMMFRPEEIRAWWEKNRNG